jgi:hypothetical protein
MPNGMPMASAILSIRELLGSKLVPWCKTFAQNINDEKNMNIFKFK